MSSVYVVCRYLIIMAAFTLHGFLIGLAIYIIVGINTSTEDPIGVGIFLILIPFITIPSIIGMRRVFLRLRKDGRPGEEAMAWGSASAILMPACICLLPFIGIIMIPLWIKLCPDLLIYIHRKIVKIPDDNKSVDKGSSAVELPK
ncbi:MAG: hypothetical protein ACYC0V_19095 [Armatimonadota bacterium]